MAKRIHKWIAGLVAAMTAVGSTGLMQPCRSWLNAVAEGITTPTDLTTMEPLPSDVPTSFPEETPTAEPTEEPTEAPTAEPTEEATEAPTVEPTEVVTEAPVAEATDMPTEQPTAELTPAPVETPAVQTYGYARLSAGTELWADPTRDELLCVLMKDAAVYMKQVAQFEVSALYIVSFVQPDGQVMEAYIKLKDVLWLTAEETQALLREMKNPCVVDNILLTTVAVAMPTAMPEVTVEPTAEPEVTAEPTAAPTVTPEVTAEPTAEPTGTPEVTAEPTTELTAMPEVTAEPTAEPTATPEVTAEPTAAPTVTPEVTAEPTAEPTATPEVTAEPTAEPTGTPEVTAEPTTEPTAMPEVTAEPTAEPTATPEVTAEPTAEPTAMPEVTAEPTAEPTATPEVTAEPTAELTAEPALPPEDEGLILELVFTVTYLDPQGNALDQCEVVEGAALEEEIFMALQSCGSVQWYCCTADGTPISDVAYAFGTPVEEELFLRALTQSPQLATPTPVPTATVEPSAEPTAVPTTEPTAHPTVEPAAEPMPDSIEVLQEELGTQTDLTPVQEEDVQPQYSLREVLESDHPDRSVQVNVTWDGDDLTMGTLVHLHAELTGYDGLNTSVFWEVDQGWGWKLYAENTEGVTFALDEENSYWQWRAGVTVQLPEK